MVQNSTVAVLFSVLGFVNCVNAQSSSIELMCRAKAKDVAAETYKGCVTELKQAHIEKIRNDYQSKLKELKEYYDGELKRVNGKSSGPSAAKEKNSGSTVVLKKVTAPSGARSVVRSLPAKANQSPVETPMAQESSQETAVVQSREMAPAPMSVELKPSSGNGANSNGKAATRQSASDFEDETTENPTAE